jgi:hypothetical protein
MTSPFLSLSCFAIFIAPTTAEPELPPQRRPSVRMSRRDIIKDSWSPVLIHVFARDRSRTSVVRHTIVNKGNQGRNRIQFLQLDMGRLSYSVIPVPQEYSHEGQLQPPAQLEKTRKIFTHEDPSKLSLNLLLSLLTFRLSPRQQQIRRPFQSLRCLPAE